MWRSNTQTGRTDIIQANIRALTLRDIESINGRIKCISQNAQTETNHRQIFMLNNWQYFLANLENHADILINVKNHGGGGELNQWHRTLEIKAQIPV